jgi:hypothetical protein
MLKSQILARLDGSRPLSMMMKRFFLLLLIKYTISSYVDDPEYASLHPILQAYLRNVESRRRKRIELVLSKILFCKIKNNLNDEAIKTLTEMTQNIVHRMQEVIDGHFYDAYHDPEDDDIEIEILLEDDDDDDDAATA